MKLITLSLLSFAFAILLCYGALRTAEAIAKSQAQRIEVVQP